MCHNQPFKEFKWISFMMQSGGFSLPLYLLAVDGWLMILRPASPDQQVPEAFTVSEGEAGIVLTD